MRGTDYELLSYIGKGMHGLVALARHTPTNELHILKIATKFDSSKDRETEIKDHMHDFMREHMLQHHAYISLEDSATTTCRVPKPVGYLKFMLEGRPRYMIVGKFVGAEKDSLKAAITVETALSKDFLSVKDWVKVFEMLMEAVKILQGQDIYHLDINDSNVLLNFSNGLDKAPTPYLIDFGFSTRQKDSRRESRGSVIIPDPRQALFASFDTRTSYPNVPPENFTAQRPHETADLYGISQLINLLCGRLKKANQPLQTVSRFITDFRNKTPDNRESFDQFRDNMIAAFTTDIQHLSVQAHSSRDADKVLTKRKREKIFKKI